jgi:hypothetical protein
MIEYSESYVSDKTTYLTIDANNGQVCKRPREQPAYQRHISIKKAPRRKSGLASRCTKPMGPLAKT